MLARWDIIILKMGKFYTVLLLDIFHAFLICYIWNGHMQNKPNLHFDVTVCLPSCLITCLFYCFFSLGKVDWQTFFFPTKFVNHIDCQESICICQLRPNQGPVVQSIISLTSSLRVISLTVLADSIYNIMIFFAEKM